MFAVRLGQGIIWRRGAPVNRRVASGALSTGKVFSIFGQRERLGIKRASDQRSPVERVAEKPFSVDAFLVGMAFKR